MTGCRYTLSKAERLSWKRYVDRLFLNGQSFIAYPLRVVYLPIEEVLGVPASFLVSVPKKKFKRAVKRNLIKRQVREAYRVHKQELYDSLVLSGKQLLVAFIYLDKEIVSFPEIEKAMIKAIRLLQEKVR